MIYSFIISGIILYALSLSCLLYFYKPEDKYKNIEEKNKWAQYLGWVSLIIGASLIFYGIPHDKILAGENHMSNTVISSLLVTGLIISVIGLIMVFVMYRKNKNVNIYYTGISLITYGLAIGLAYPGGIIM